VTLRTARGLMLAVPATVYFFSYFHRVSLAVVAADLMRAFGVSAAALGALAATYPYVFAAMALVAGSLADTLGPRRTIAAGGATMGLGAAAFGLAPSFDVAVGGRLLVGLGASVILIAWLSLAAVWFRPAEFGLVSGTTQAVGNIGALVAATPLALLVEALGWRPTFVLIGMVTLVLAATAFGVVRDRPESLGLPPVNAGPDRRPGGGLGRALAAIREVVANRRTWPPILAAGGIYAGLITFLGLWGVPYLTQVYDLGRVEAANHVSAVTVGIIVGSPLVGWLSDQWLRRRRLPMVVFCALYATSWLPLLLPADSRLPLALLAPCLFLMGFASSGLVLVWACVREVNDPARVGIALGFVNAPIFLGFALFQSLTGALLDARWEGLAREGARLYPAAAYRGVFLLCALLAAAAVVAAAAVTETRCRSVWRPRETGSA
jgi:sugar phosphate permease